MRDRTFGWEMRTWARLQIQSGKSKVFMYYLSHVPPLPNAAWLGAQHGAEIPYAFNWPNGKHSTMVPWTETDRKLAEQVSSYWVNFATTGDPNGKGLPAWPVYKDKASGRAMLLGGGKMEPEAPPNQQMFALYDGLWKQQMSPAVGKTAQAR